jgi:hypothetical protein
MATAKAATTTTTLVALTSFACEVNGVEHQLREGERVPADHPVVSGRESLFTTGAASGA